MLSLANFATKRADQPYVAGLGPEHAAYNESLKADALRVLAKAGLIGLGVGGGASLLTHLLRPKKKLQPAEGTDVDLPYPQPKFAAQKRADWADALVHHSPLGTPEGAPSPTVGSPRWFRGDAQSTMGSIPWVVPGAMAAGLGGLYGGHALVRHILKKRRKARLDAEVESARKEYEDAMLGQYDPEKVHKIAGAPLNLLDAAHAVMEKAGDMQDLLGYGGGTYVGLAGLLAAMSAYGAYKGARGREKGKLLADAMKQRALARQAASPANVFLHTVPAHLQRPEEEEGAAPDGLSVG